VDAHNAQDALMTAQARFEKWQTEFMQKWGAPGQKTDLKKFYSMLPADAKDTLKTQDPEKWAKLQKYLSKQ
jgi:hypothetical protein